MTNPTEIICPITFIGKEAKRDNNINTLFTNPYDTKVAMDFTHSMMCDMIKPEEPNENDVIWAKKVSTNVNIASNNAIIAYLVTNITELCYQTLIKFLANTFTPRAYGIKSTNIADGSLTDAAIVSGYLKTVDIQNTVMCIINGISNNYAGLRNFEPQQIYIVIDTVMDRIYPLLVVNVFEKFIIDHMSNAVEHKAIDALYELLYSQCYGEPEDHKIEIPEPEIEFSFCSSILREGMERVLVEFRTSLSMVARTAAAMVVNDSSNFTDHLLDNNYSTNNFIEDNSYARNVLKINRLTSDDCDE